MRYKLKSLDETMVFALSGEGSLTWSDGDMLIMRDGRPRIVPKELAALFLEPDSELEKNPAPLAVARTKSKAGQDEKAQETPEIDPRTRFVAQPPAPPKKRTAPAWGYRRQSIGRSKVTRWIVDSRPPIQVMEGRVLAALFDLTAPDWGPVTVAELRSELTDRDLNGIGPRIRELNLKGFVELSKIDGRRYLVLGDVGRRAVELFGDEMRAAEPPEPKNAG